MGIDYDKPAQFVLDGVRFSYRGETFKGQGFLNWDPKTGFHVDALLDKNFAPVGSWKTLGQIIINGKEDTFSMWLNVRGHGRAFVPTAFPNSQRHSFTPDNHLSMKVQRVIFVSRRPQVNDAPSRFWSGSADYLTVNKFEFPDPFNTQSTLGGQPFNANMSTGLYHDDDGKWAVTGRSLSDEKFELSWALNKNCWRRTDAWRFGEAARRSMSIVFAQTVWIAKQDLTRNGKKTEELRQPDEAKSLSYFFHPLLGKDLGVVEDWKFNKVAFLKLTEFFLRGGLHAETCWNMFCQMAVASSQQNIQAKELLLATILEAAFRTIYGHPFQERKSGPPFVKRIAMERFRSDFFSDKWIKHCEAALEVHSKLRHRNAHPDWLISRNGVLSKSELKKSYERQVYLSRFYGYMILGMAGFKDLEPLFPVVRFSEDK